jgi:DNA-directed RNA polymerase delta subunit
MNIKQKANEFRSIVNKMADLYEKKNSNYGDSFGQLYKELGPTAGLVPLWNKLHRATSLIKGDENHFESIEDTLKDLACYAIMNLIEMKAEQESKCHSASEPVKTFDRPGQTEDG